MTNTDIQSVVRERYGRAAQAVESGTKGSCCGGSCGTSAEKAIDAITGNLYRPEEIQGLPEQAFLASLGCGNPTALAELAPGEVVLDLGSGGGIDVLLSASRVGSTGKVYGLDMTDEMLELARKNQERAGVTNVEFIRGTIEDIPLPDASVDVIISNCVINLSADKDLVLKEAYRVLKPGGRFAVSDIVVRKPLPTEVQRSMSLWTGCVAGALVQSDYDEKLTSVGFQSVDFEETRRYSREDIVGMSQDIPQSEGGPDAVLRHADELDGAVMSAFIRASKPSH